MKAKEIFLKAFDSHSDEIFRFCFYKVSDKVVAQDLVQEVFIRYWKCIVKGEDAKNVKAFFIYDCQKFDYRPLPQTY